MKLVIHPDFLTLKPFLEQIPLRFQDEGRTIYKLRNEIKVFNVNGFSLNIKSFKKPHFINRLVYTFFRKSKAQRAFDNGRKLLSMGIGTPEPVAYLEIYSGLFFAFSYFVSLQIEDVRTFQEFSDGSDVNGREDLLIAFGEFVALMHQKDVMPLDLSTGNILFKKNHDKIQFWMVDLNRMSFSTVPFLKASKNFERLRGNDEFFRLIIESYAKIRTYDAKCLLKEVLQRKEKSIRFFQKKRIRKQRIKQLKESLGFS